MEDRVRAAGVHGLGGIEALNETQGDEAFDVPPHLGPPEGHRVSLEVARDEPS